jgi:Cellulose binding domain
MAQPMATHARPTPLGTAVRRVVVTPTFAAGLGVVIAAGMAYPMTKTVISYGGAPPAGGGSCLTAGCVGDGSGELATASPGQRLESPPPASPDPSPVPSGGGAVAAGSPVMQYQTLRQWDSGFFGQVTITDTGGSEQAKWQLRLSYDSAHIIGVWGGKWTASGDHAVVVTPDSGDGTSHNGGSSVQVVLAVSGRAGPPSCAFNGRTCQMGHTDGQSQPTSSPSQDWQSQSTQSGSQQTGSWSGR